MPLEAGMFTSDNTTWGTPDYVFDPINKLFRFDLDAAASAENAKCDVFITAAEDCLTVDWWKIGTVAWLKAGQDGLVAVPAKTDKNGVHWPAIPGVLVGDDRNHLEGGRVTFEPSEGPWVQVTLEALEGS